MEKQLRNVIREAFNIAYSTHKVSKLFESSQDMKASMSSGDVYKTEDVFRKLKENPSLAAEYAWTPQGSANGALNVKQFNLLVEMIFENADFNTQSKIFMGLYNDKSPALINRVSQYLTGKKGTNVTAEEAAQALEIAWNEMFLGEKYKSGEGMKKSFADAVAEYVPTINKRGSASNFGAYFMGRLLNAASTAFRDTVTADKPLSLDAPSLKTGKPKDIGDEGGEDFGSDTLHQLNIEPELKDIGAGLENPEAGIDVGDEGRDEYALADDSEEDEMDGETVGQDLDSSVSDEATPAERHARKMIRILNLSIKQAIKEFRGTGKVTESQEKGLVALEQILSTGIEPNALSSKLGYNVTTAIQDLKKNKAFVNMVDDYLFTNGFLNARGKVDSFINMKPLYLAKAAKYMLTGDVSHLMGLNEGVFSFVDEVIMENFMKKNLDKIMERVYKKLSKKL